MRAPGTTLPKRRLERVETGPEQAHRGVQMKLELARDVGIQGIEYGHVDPPGTGVLPHGQRAESLAKAVGKGGYELRLGPHDLEGRHIRTTELTLDELEKLGAICGECRRKIRASRDGNGQQSLDLGGRNPAPEQEFRELG